MRRYPATSTFASSFGPGPLTPAIKVLMALNVAAFLLAFVAPAVTLTLGLRPADVFERMFFWQPLTYMFIHGSVFHILFNMLSLWMFGTELERMWGSRYFVKFYLIAGGGAALTQIVLGLIPPLADQMYYTLTIGASGAVYGVLLAYALYFPYRPILFFMIFPIQARYFVMIIGAISLLASAGGGGGGVAHTAHLGGLITAYLYLKGGGGRTHLLAEIKYRYLKWRINRMRRRFDVYSGGRSNDVDRRVH